jgi:hypothetical protein
MTDSHSETDIAKRRDAALTRALFTPPKPKAGAKKLAKKPAWNKNVQKQETALPSTLLTPAKTSTDSVTAWANRVRKRLAAECLGVYR